MFDGELRSRSVNHGSLRSWFLERVMKEPIIGYDLGSLVLLLVLGFGCDEALKTKKKSKGRRTREAKVKS